MTAFQIKILALATMIADHIGLFFFPDVLWLRMVGRLSFPLFAWLIANGAHHTHDMKAYSLRLLLFAIIAQIPFIAANQLLVPTFFELNVLFTLLFGLVAIIIIKQSKNPAVWVFSTTLTASLAQLLHTDYGAFGVVMVVLFYIFFRRFNYLFGAQYVLFLIMFIFFRTNLIGFIEPLGFLSLLFISLYNNKPGIKAKYLFYVVYPLQYVVYYLVLKVISQ